MTDVVITGASRGIGHALALALANPSRRLVLVARDAAALDALAVEIARSGCEAVAVPGDVGTLASARQLGDRLGEIVAPGATIVHNAGVWPAQRVRNEDGFESAYAVNVLGPLVLQRALGDARKLARVMVVGAGLMVKGRFDPARTPTGEDFSAFRTYATTKLCFAIAMREVAARHPELDVVVLHPGVVRTDLGARSGVLGALLALVKRRWESPATCAERLARVLGRERWSTAGEAMWLFEEEVQPWPEVAEDETTRARVRAAVIDALSWQEMP